MEILTGYLEEKLDVKYPFNDWEYGHFSTPATGRSIGLRDVQKTQENPKAATMGCCV